MLNASHFDLSFICLCLHTYVQCSYIIVATRFAVENRKANELLTTLFHKFPKSRIFSFHEYFNRSKIELFLVFFYLLLAFLSLIKVHIFNKDQKNFKKISQFVLTLQIIFKLVGDFFKVFGLLRMYVHTLKIRKNIGIGN